jgi:hypothetical protein
MTPAQGVFHALAEQAWQLRSVTVAMRLGGCDVTVTADSAYGPVRVRHARTCAPYVEALSEDERWEVRRRLTEALELAARKAG